MSKDLVIVRTYQALELSDASKAFERDARKLAADGYRPVGQSWQEGHRQGLNRLFIGGILFRPKGSLSVTYQLETAAPAPIIVQAPATAPTPPAPARKKEPKPEGPRVEGEYWR